MREGTDGSQFYQSQGRGTSLAVQRLGLCAFTDEGTGSIPGQGIKIPQAVCHSQKKKKVKGMAFMLIPMCPMLMADIANQSQNFFLKPLMCFKINFNYISNVCLFIFWLHWVFIAARGLSLVAASGDYSSLRCAGFSLQWLLLLRSTGSRHSGFSSCWSRALERRLSSCGARA